MSNMCDIFLAREAATLSPYAFLTANTQGRDHPYVKCVNRTEFQRDRDRIIHSQAFRRLMNKTQVFLAPVGDHYRTRLTHTLEVTQIARIIARALRLNEDLTEAAALGHDLGHTPFGHAGEDALRQCFDPSFAHSEQSIRVVERLENDGQGLNLTVEVRDGILNHTGQDRASTLEGYIVKFADRIAYINHDIDDAIRAGILTPEDIPAHLREVLGAGHGVRINTMVTSLIEGSMERNDLCMTEEVGRAMNELREFLFVRVYRNSEAKREEAKAKILVMRLYEYFVGHPDKMPSLYQTVRQEESVERAVADYISGMSDRYAIELYKELFVPEVWRGKP